MRLFHTFGVAAVSALAFTLATSATAQSDSWRTGWYAPPQPSWGENFVLPMGAPEALAGKTIRQQVRVNLAGDALRVTLSNRYGRHRVRLDDLQVDGRPLSFEGQSVVTLEPGAERVSDPLAYNVRSGDDLVVSLRVVEAAGLETLHWDARSTAHLSDSTGGTETSTVRFYLSSVQVKTNKSCPAFVALGDSITDGNGVPMDENTRWTDILARRAEGVAIVNAGISGARLLTDGMGEDALARLEADVVSHPGVEEVFVLLGTNDIAWPGSPFEPQAMPMTLERLQQGYRDLAEAVRKRGLRIVGATIPPFKGALPGTPMEATYWSPDKETVRLSLNAWLREAHPFDDLIDLDVVLRDPTSPDRLNPDFDSGDRLHPGSRGNAAIASTIDLDALGSEGCRRP